MDRRKALAVAASTTLSLTALGAAIGATTHIFQPAEAANLGQVSPVSQTTLPPVVEEHRLDVVDPAPAPASAPAPRAPETERHEEPESPPVSAGTPTATATPAPTAAEPEHHESEDHAETEADD